MSSIKCPHCGLVNFASAKSCKRCKQLLVQSRAGSIPGRVPLNERAPLPGSWATAIKIGSIFTVIGIVYVYLDGVFSFKALVPLFGIGLIVIGCISFQREKRAAQIAEAEKLEGKHEDELASPLQLKITGGYMLAVGLGCIIWGSGWLINGIPLRGFGFILAIPGIVFVVFSNSLTLRKSVPRIASRRG